MMNPSVETLGWSYAGVLLVAGTLGLYVDPTPVCGVPGKRRPFSSCGRSSLSSVLIPSVLVAWGGAVPCMFRLSPVVAGWSLVLGLVGLACVPALEAVASAGEWTGWTRVLGANSRGAGSRFWHGCAECASKLGIFLFILAVLALFPWLDDRASTPVRLLYAFALVVCALTFRRVFHPIFALAARQANAASGASAVFRLYLAAAVLLLLAALLPLVPFLFPSPASGGWLMVILCGCVALFCAAMSLFLGPGRRE